MREVEDLLRSSLVRRAEDITPRNEAIGDAVSAVQAVRRRRRARATFGVLGATVAAGAIAAGAVTIGVSHRDVVHPQNLAVPQYATPRLSVAPAPSKPTKTAAASVVVTKEALLASVFGSDYIVQPKSSSGWGGDLTLTANSLSAKGLPAGYQAAISVDLLASTGDSGQGSVDALTAMCQPMQEKGASSTGCTTQKIRGLTINRYVMQGANTKVGTFETLRFLYQRPDKRVQYAEVTIWNTLNITNDAERASGSTWVDAQSDRVAEAAVGSLG